MAVRSAFLGVDPSGEMAAECFGETTRAELARWARAGEWVEKAAQQWPLHERALGHLLVGAEAIVKALSSAGAPVSFSQLTPLSDEKAAQLGGTKLQPESAKGSPLPIWLASSASSTSPASTASFVRPAP